MKTYYQKSGSDRAIGGIEAVQMSDEHYEQIKGKLEFFSPESDEVRDYLSTKAQTVAAAQLSGLMAAVQSHIDAPAKALGYDHMISMISYASSSVPKFAAEAMAGVQFRDACWGAAYQVQLAVQTGTRAIPTPEELVALLPMFEVAS